jgi:hypothetical protein
MSGEFLAAGYRIHLVDVMPLVENYGSLKSVELPCVEQTLIHPFKLPVVSICTICFENQ